MVHINRFLITFSFLLVGLGIWLNVPNYFGLAALLVLGFLGALLGTIISRKQAAQSQQTAEEYPEPNEDRREP